MLILQTFSGKGPLGEIKELISFNFRTIVRLLLDLLGRWSSILCGDRSSLLLCRIAHFPKACTSEYFWDSALLIQRHLM